MKRKQKVKLCWLILAAFMLGGCAAGTGSVSAPGTAQEVSESEQPGNGNQEEDAASAEAEGIADGLEAGNTETQETTDNQGNHQETTDNQENQQEAPDGQENRQETPDDQGGLSDTLNIQENPQEEAENLKTAGLYIDEMVMEEVDLKAETVALTSSPAAVSTMLVPVASGTLTKTSDRAEIDYSNTADGYVMVRFPGATSARLKVQVKGPATTYTYNLSQGSAWTTFPLTDGNGGYQVTVYENVTGSKYATVLSVSMTVQLKDEFGPYLRPNQYVNYENAPNTVAKAADLCAGQSGPLKKVEQVYNFVVNHLSYDKQLAASVQSGYLPDLDAVLAKGTGICFDYAALMTGMLRSQSVPCRLVVGYAGTAYHAWISVWSAETGWIEGVVYFDGSSWQRMDPTFASSGGSSSSVMQYIGDGSNYTAKYYY